ncbi:SprT family zinc-dependent metalloprotease [Maritimibacter sp. UBA3975]|uniref:M48 family metallopeptidase n=1 Tax=Maritimibacter sp. UBA3975 TaxID=1946833 RepID=UPI0025BC7F38|nr:SprT family zinc-dependent metalloprotease [Maritimibacter sp. UBA3975]|tara:strand:- start:59902 stop:60642 length:741 start_codon:yes stop_codon:yes gene_type:complete
MGLRQALFGNGKDDDPGVISLPANPEVAVRLKRSARARRLSLRISSLDGKVTLTVPARLRRAEAEAFVREKSDWILGHLSKMPGEVRPMPGDHLPVEGALREVTAASRRGVALVGDRLEVPLTGVERTPARIGAFLKVAARERLMDASERHAARIGREVGKVTLRDTRSRWGSCSHEGNLMYSWRLVMAPPAVLDYVAAHEVAHLVHMDHSAAFWRQCAELFPDHKAQRRWLREEGGALHRYRFRD